jgi:hypothetical protein
LEVVGESNYQAALVAERSANDGEDEIGVILAPEPENTFDPKAVAVRTFKNVVLGYLAREEAARYQGTLLELRARGLVAICSGQLRGGRGDKPHIGIWLDVEVPTAVAAAFGIKYQRQSKRRM